MFTDTPEWKTVIIEPERLRSGLWGYEEGDVYASYSADTYGEKKQVRRAFTYAHMPHVAMGTQTNGFASPQAKSYPILHSSYVDEVMAEYRACGLKDGYVGKPIKRHGNDCIFGLPVIFKQRPLKQVEIIDLTRRMYAYGGLFAAEAGTYDNLILNWYVQYADKRLRKAFMKELGEQNLPQSRDAMREMIEGAARPEPQQMILL